jgi:hypothetical protein
MKMAVDWRRQAPQTNTNERIRQISNAKTRTMIKRTRGKRKYTKIAFFIKNDGIVRLKSKKVGSNWKYVKPGAIMNGTNAINDVKHMSINPV